MLGKPVLLICSGRNMKGTCYEVMDELMLATMVFQRVSRPMPGALINEFERIDMLHWWNRCNNPLIFIKCHLEIGTKAWNDFRVRQPSCTHFLCFRTRKSSYTGFSSFFSQLLNVILNTWIQVKAHYHMGCSASETAWQHNQSGSYCDVLGRHIRKLETSGPLQIAFFWRLE